MIKETIRILGIDPGLRHTGWGLIELSGPRLRHIDHGVIKTDTTMSLGQRLAVIHAGILEIVQKYAPDYAGIEETFVNANPRQALMLGQARGAALVALASCGLAIGEYSARKIKLSLVGSGKADKAQMQFMVARLLPRAGKMSDDAADALACAICAAHNQPQAGVRA